MFALRKKGTDKLMGFSSTNNDDSNFCSEVSYYISTYNQNVWVVYDRSIAEKAAITNTPWYNADYETPQNEFVGQLEVVELGVIS